MLVWHRLVSGWVTNLDLQNVTDKAFYSHMSGELPIRACFATNGLETKAYFMSRHQAHCSIGDHSPHVLDFIARSVLRTDLPAATKRSGCKLQWKISPVRKKYTRDLVKTSMEHKLNVKTDKLKCANNFETEDDYQQV